MCVEGKPSKTNAVYLAFRTAGLPLDIWIWIAPMYSSAHKQLVYTDRPAVSKFSVSRIYIDSGLQVVKFACPPSSLDQGFRYTTLLIYRLFSIGCLSPFIQYCVFYILKASFLLYLTTFCKIPNSALRKQYNIHAMCNWVELFWIDHKFYIYLTPRRWT